MHEPSQGPQEPYTWRDALAGVIGIAFALFLLAMYFGFTPGN